jgi:D-3-phosphoglycerate dehydrogenase
MAKPTKVLLLENIHPSAHALFREAGVDLEVTKGALGEKELIEKLQTGVQVLGIRSKTKVTQAVLDAAPDLMTVGCFCIGTNQVALAHANERGVPVFNAPFSNTRSVAELVISEVIALARQLGDRSREVHEGKWRKVADGCVEVRGKTLGIIGYGHIGRQVGVLAEMIGMRVVFFDSAARLPMGNNRSCPTMEALLGEADFVTLHVPETPQTANMIGEAQLSQMKKGSYLLNLSRGTVVVIEALAAAITSGHIAGAAVDVYPEEPETNSDGFQSPLRGLPNVILTPHVGGSTMEAQEAIGREVATALLKFIDHGTTVGAVNFPQVELPRTEGKYRVVNVHKNVPGVLRDINRCVSELDGNVYAQVLSTDPHTGYLVIDLDNAITAELSKSIASLPTSLRTRAI